MDGSTLPKQYLVRRSKKLPKWLWITIAHSLGIKIRPTNRPIIATILYTITILSALGNKVLPNPFCLFLQVFLFLFAIPSFLSLTALVTTTLTYVVASVIQSHNGSIKIHPTSSSSSALPVIVHNDIILDGVVMVSITCFWYSYFSSLIQRQIFIILLFLT